MAQNAAHAVNQMQNCWLWRPVEPPKWVKDTRNGPQMVSLIDLSLFLGSLTYLGINCLKPNFWLALVVSVSYALI